MSNIVISGYYGFGNAGDEAMLCAIIDAIRKEEADAHITCLLYTSDAADEEDSVDLGGRRIIKKKFFFQAEDGIRD